MDEIQEQYTQATDSDLVEDENHIKHQTADEMQDHEWRQHPGGG